MSASGRLRSRSTREARPCVATTYTQHDHQSVQRAQRPGRRGVDEPRDDLAAGLAPPPAGRERGRRDAPRLDVGRGGRCDRAVDRALPDRRLGCGANGSPRGDLGSSARARTGRGRRRRGRARGRGSAHELVEAGRRHVGERDRPPRRPHHGDSAGAAGLGRQRHGRVVLGRRRADPREARRQASGPRRRTGRTSTSRMRGPRRSRWIPRATPCSSGITSPTRTLPGRCRPSSATRPGRRS